MIIGITGSFGTGKTTVALMFGRLGCRVINADKLYSSLIKPKTALYRKVVEAFGTAILNKNKTVNRPALRRLVFSDPLKLKKLNTLTHPAILSKIRELVKKNKNKKHNKHIILDAPLLMEAKAAYLVDKIIVVKTPYKKQIQRLIKRGGYAKKEIINIIKSQLPLKQKLRYADYIVDNGRDLKYTRQEVKKIWQDLK